MKVSIIIPVYNVEAYITECLESVARQTYQGDVECLIVDDCGTDKSIPKAEAFVRDYRGNFEFRILRHSYNRGLSAARNTGVDAAKGDYIFFLDSDDAIIPETIEKMVKVVHEHPAAEMVQGGMTYMGEQATENSITLYLPDYTEDSKWIAINMLFLLPVSSWNRLLKREFLLKEKIAFHEGIIHEDVPYCYMLSLKCRYIGFVRENTYLFRPQRESSITTTPQDERALRSRLVIINDCIKLYQSCQKHDMTRSVYALRFLWIKWMTYMSIASYELLKNNKEEINKTLKKLYFVTPWYAKPLALIYSLLPLRLKHNGLFLKISNLC